VEQKESLRHLIAMLSVAPLNDDSKFLLTDLKQLYGTFEKAGNADVFDKTALAPITNEIASLRKKVTLSA
jgi:hypothetical protein